MATKESIAIRRDLAAQSIQASLAQIGAHIPDMPALQLVRYERDLDERNAGLLEEVARGMAHVADWFVAQKAVPELEPEPEAVPELEPEPEAEPEPPTGKSKKR